MHQLYGTLAHYAHFGHLMQTSYIIVVGAVNEEKEAFIDLLARTLGKNTLYGLTDKGQILTFFGIPRQSL